MTPQSSVPVLVDSTTTLSASTAAKSIGHLIKLLKANNNFFQDRQTLKLLGQLCWSMLAMLQKVIIYINPVRQMAISGVNIALPMANTRVNSVCCKVVLYCAKRTVSDTLR